ncbi:MAG TPA: GtrA family protein [Solirubrobacteraceae bacterium]|jgi:putative flippase GtrA|nr:GtrA family protein [Solirubrobacteraceae bacterium]
MLAHIRSPERGILGQGIRFALAGGTVAGVYLVTTLLLATVIGLPFQSALAIGFILALATHFTLQRFFVWVHDEEFALPLRTQVGRYLAVALAQYGITVVATSALPAAVGLPTEVVYVAVTLLITLANFVLFRTRVFHAEAEP